MATSVIVCWLSCVAQNSRIYVARIRLLQQGHNTRILDKFLNTFRTRHDSYHGVSMLHRVEFIE